MTTKFTVAAYVKVGDLTCVSEHVKTYSVAEMVKLSVYAGFPAMIIGSAATFLELPLLDFNLTYVLGMTFYLMFIMNRLDRDRQQREWQDKEQQ